MGFKSLNNLAVGLLMALSIVGCGGGGGGASATSDTLSYDAQMTTLSGTVNIVRNDNFDIDGYEKTITYDNFEISTLPECPITDFSVSPESMVFTSTEPQSASVSVTFSQVCEADQMILKTRQRKSLTVNGVVFPESISTQQFVFGINGADGFPIDTPVASNSYEIDASSFDTSAKETVETYPFTIRVNDSGLNALVSDNIINKITLQALTTDTVAIVNQQGDAVNSAVYTGNDATATFTGRFVTKDATGQGAVNVIVETIKDGVVKTTNEVLYFLVQNQTEYVMNLSTPTTQIDQGDLDGDTLSANISELNSGTAPDTSVINSMIFSSSDPDVLVFADENLVETNEYALYGSEATAAASTTVIGKNAGTATVTVTASVIIEGELVNVVKSLEFTVTGNEITSGASFSITKTETSYENGVFTETYLVKGVSEDGASSMSGLPLQAGIISDIHSLGTVGNSSVTGELVQSTAGRFFSSDGQTFPNVVFDDTVVILPDNGFDKGDFLGGWTVNSVAADGRITLKEVTDTVATEDDLNFIIGDQSRENCDFGLALASVEFEGGVNTLDENGEAKLTVKYDTFMVGKNVYMYVNTTDEISPRVGGALAVNFKGSGLSSVDIVCAANSTCQVSQTINLGNDAVVGDASSELAQRLNIAQYECTAGVGGDCDNVNIYLDVQTNCDGVLVGSIENNSAGEVTISTSTTIDPEY